MTDCQVLPNIRHHGWFAAAKLPSWRNARQHFVSHKDAYFLHVSLWDRSRGVSVDSGGRKAQLQVSLQSDVQVQTLIGRNYPPNPPLGTKGLHSSFLIHVHHNVPPTLVIMKSSPPKLYNKACVLARHQISATFVNDEDLSPKNTTASNHFGRTTKTMCVFRKICLYSWNLFQATFKRWENSKSLVASKLPLKFRPKLFVHWAHWASMKDLRHFSTYINKLRTVQRRRCQNFCFRRAQLQTVNCKLRNHGLQHINQIIWNRSKQHKIISITNVGQPVIMPKLLCVLWVRNGHVQSLEEDKQLKWCRMLETHGRFFIVNDDSMRGRWSTFILRFHCFASQACNAQIDTLNC